ncbi:MAG: Outer membrane protein A precursor [Candidatus Ozemobacter sibiricus]|uniref:Outer membrane protein A n=1 Tax=Candidatus Ozemobacter sibiricus TaxID=2268124 RepID=A0A367ZQ85_9BACT|nr:MAG: Outer membrane protein A precursor [Candidatus Ozemobacter sibiricus]
MSKRSYLWLFFALIAVCASGTAARADLKLVNTSAPRDILLAEQPAADPTTLGVLKVEEMTRADFPIKLATNREAEGDVFAIGEALSLTFTSEKDCYLTVVDFTPGGNMLVLFPNKWVADNFVAARQVIRIPQEGATYTLKVGGPTGTDVVKAIATSRKVDVLDPANQQLAGPFAVIKDKRSATRDLLLLDTAGAASPDQPAATEASTASPPAEPLQWSAAAVTVHATGASPDDGGFGVIASDGWVIKAWTDAETAKIGQKIFLKFHTNRPCRLESLVNRGTSGQENVLLPAGSTPELAPHTVNTLPAGSDTWAFEISGPAGLDTIVARLKTPDDRTAEVSLKIKVTE